MRGDEISLDPMELKLYANEMDLIAFSENSGWMSEMARVLSRAAERIEQLEGICERKEGRSRTSP